MKKKDIIEKLKEDLKCDTDYTFIVLDLRDYPHKEGLFVGYNIEEK